MAMLLNIIVTLLLIYWPIITVGSAMMYDAPGASDEKSRVLLITLFLYYPLFIFLGLDFYNSQYFGVDAGTCIKVSFWIILISTTLLGHNLLLLNALFGPPSIGYGIKRNKVYFNGKRVWDADASSFKPLLSREFGHTTPYGKDDHYLYYEGAPVRGGDVKNLRTKHVGNTLFLVSDHQIIYDNNVIDNVNLETLTVYDDEYPVWLRLEVAGHIKTYYTEPSSLASIDTDEKTFRPLNHHYAKDKNHIYRHSKIILPEADPSTFKLLSAPFARDKQYVYVLHHNNEYILTGADPKSFAAIDSQLGRDSNQVYWVNNDGKYGVLAAADPKSFEIINGQFTRDKNYVFVMQTKAKNNILSGADPDSFAVIDNEFACDDQYVYFIGSSKQIQRVEGPAGSDFEKLGRGYYRSQNRIYYANDKELLPLIAAEAASFEVLEDTSLSSWDARDQHNHYYFAGERVPALFKFL